MLRLALNGELVVANAVKPDFLAGDEGTEDGGSVKATSVLAGKDLACFEDSPRTGAAKGDGDAEGGVAEVDEDADANILGPLTAENGDLFAA